MIKYGLRTKIAVNLIIFLLAGMVLLALVMIASAQRMLVKTEMAKGKLLISAMEMTVVSTETIRNRVTFDNHQDKFDRLLETSGYSCALILDYNLARLYAGGRDCGLDSDMERLTRRALLSGENQSAFHGLTWGIFWQERSALILACPLYRSGRVVAATSVVLSLKNLNSVLQDTYRILLIYIIINTLALTLVGIMRLSSLIVNPVNKLLKRANEYHELSEDFFIGETGENEFNQLSKALNRMLKRISDDKEALRSTVTSLEHANAELKQAYKDIMRAEKLASVGRLSSGLAHEIGNPIGIVIGYLELLRDIEISQEERLEFARRAEDELNRINNIIRQLLDFSRPTDGHFEAVSVHAIIKEVVETIHFQPVMSHIDLSLDLSAERDTVFMDGGQLRQVCLNLILNAADAISSEEDSDEGRIEIFSTTTSNTQEGTRDLPKMLELRFKDNGSGISEENIGNVFDPFFTTKAPGKGTGLGLSVSFMIVESAGGTIQALSEEGEGTTMLILLPLVTEKQPPPGLEE